MGFNPFLVRASVYCPKQTRVFPKPIFAASFNPFLVRASVYWWVILVCQTADKKISFNPFLVRASVY